MLENGYFGTAILLLTISAPTPLSTPTTRIWTNQINYFINTLTYTQFLFFSTAAVSYIPTI
ncbi:hypothetical protein F4860DRAFT_485688 [Xylaria cubensis]|nr:hypothetical protein F4860DRAFT_485688 [Xylaria cubensis]